MNDNDDESQNFLNKKDENENILSRVRFNSISTKAINNLYNLKIPNENKNDIKINSAPISDNLKFIFDKQVIDIKDNKSNENIKSKEIICPKCEKSCNIDIFDYQILLYGCKKNHKTNNIFFKEFELTQIKDKNKIICDYCKESKKNKLLDDEFYYCFKCKKKICSSCELNHDKNHNIVNYEQKNFICHKHNKSYSSYCKGCTKNICELCEEKHYNHEIINFEDILPNINELKMKTNQINIEITKLNDNINEMIKILESVIQNVDLYYKIYNDIIFGFNRNNLNYKLLCNINKISRKNDILENLYLINMEESLINKFPLIYNLYKKMNIKETNEITINYKIKGNKNEIKIFNKLFTFVNKNNCKIIYEDNEYELQDKFKINNKNKNILTITLRGIRNINYIESMFSGCESLLSVPDIWKWNTSNIEDMHSLFSGCKSLSSLPDISKWDTSKVIDMSYMFYKCSSLKNLPDISKWDTSNVKNMSFMFSQCSSLEYLPDISKWDIKNLKKKNDMFSYCKNSLKPPSKFKESFFDIFN